jgi:diguanylate cyclase (GGDEF)-like protein
MAMDPFVVSDSSDAWGVREEILTVTAGRFLGCLHHTFITARIAGDEFLVLTEGIRGVDGAAEVAEQILMAVRGPEPSVSEGTLVTASVGIALQETGMAAEHLLINADIALYSARNGGGNRYQVFEDWMRDTALTKPLAV